MVSGPHTGQCASRPPAPGKQLLASHKERHNRDDRQNRRMCSVGPFKSILSDTIVLQAPNRYLWSIYCVSNVVLGAS